MPFLVNVVYGNMHLITVAQKWVSEWVREWVSESQSVSQSLSQLNVIWKPYNPGGYEDKLLIIIIKVNSKNDFFFVPLCRLLARNQGPIYGWNAKRILLRSTPLEILYILSGPTSQSWATA